MARIMIDTADTIKDISSGLHPVIASRDTLLVLFLTVRYPPCVQLIVINTHNIAVKSWDQVALLVIHKIWDFLEFSKIEYFHFVLVNEQRTHWLHPGPNNMTMTF